MMFSALKAFAAKAAGVVCADVGAVQATSNWQRQKSEQAEADNRGGAHYLAFPLDSNHEGFNLEAERLVTVEIRSIPLNVLT